MICKQCGNEFNGHTMEFQGITVEQMYCSDDCRKIAWKEFKRQERFDIYKDKKLECIEDGILPSWFVQHITPNETQRPLYEQACKSKACCWIYGKTGRGKTQLARMIIQHHLSLGKRCAFETAANLFNNEKRYVRLQYIPILCIDDIHVCAFGDYTSTLLHDCLSLREGLRLRTLVTCETDVYEFAKQFSNIKFGHSTLARLDACGKRLDLKVDGDNLRRM